MDLKVSDLGSDVIGAFDVQFGLFEDVLSFNADTSTIGDPVNGDQLNFSSLAISGFDRIEEHPKMFRVWELSLDMEEELIQKQRSDAFVLARLQFTTLKFGTEFLNIDPIETVISDASGFPLDYDIKQIGIGPFPQASARVDVIPEPATLLLIGTGLAGLAVFRRRLKGSNH